MKEIKKRHHGEEMDESYIRGDGSGIGIFPISLYRSAYGRSGDTSGIALGWGDGKYYAGGLGRWNCSVNRSGYTDGEGYGTGDGNGYCYGTGKINGKGNGDGSGYCSGE